MTGSDQQELEAIELDLLTEGVRRHYDVDLGAYAKPLVLRRLRRFVSGQGLASLSSLQAQVLHDADLMETLLATLTSDPAPLFESPAFIAAFRREVAPWLRTHPSIRIWQVGCAAPEDLYSLAIVLQEEGLLSRTRLYVTDASESLLARAREGWTPMPGEDADDRYRAAGGHGRLRDHFELNCDRARLRPALHDRIFYSQHHLAHEGPFNEFHAVLCRNTLVYFRRQHHARIHGLLFESIARHGYLALGAHESIQRSPFAAAWEEIEGAGRLFRRMS
jgi:chemotaxis protein methyltransferase CheR